MSSELVDNCQRNEEVEDDEESIHDGETNIDIGIINENEKTSQTRLILHSSTFYPCKLGGKPQWLEYRNLKNLNDCLVCESCKLRLSFLLQIYAPLNQNKENEDNLAFHRYLYLFICSNSNCSNKTFHCYRSQLSQLNDIYSCKAPPVANTIELTENGNADANILNKEIEEYKFIFLMNVT